MKKNLEILTTYKCNFTCDYCDINYLNHKKADPASSCITLDAILNENDIAEVALCAKEPILDSNFSNIYNKIKDYDVIVFSNASDKSTEKFLSFDFETDIRLILSFHPNFISIRDFTTNCLKLSQKFRIDAINIMVEDRNYNSYFKKLKSLFITQINIRQPFYNLTTTKRVNRKGLECHLKHLIFFNFVTNKVSRCFPYNILNKDYNGVCESNFCSCVDY